MGVRPPSNDVDESPDVIEFGIAALDAKLSDTDVSFPADQSELQEAFGETAVPYNASGREMPMEELLDSIHKSYFESEQEFLNAAHPVFERKRERASTSLLAQLRQLVPF